MRDFTRHTYRKLLEALKNQGYDFQTVEEFLGSRKERVVVLRHDSDIWPLNDLLMARVEKELNIKSTYYFRVPETFDESIILEIKSLNHEIGYHYEDLVRTQGKIDEAKVSFKHNLAKLRLFYPVKTISRHGRPLSKIESLDMWKQIDYKSEFDLLGEVYLDINYSSILYLTDNGSCWNAHKSNIRDVVQNSSEFLNVSSTFDLIQAINHGQTPNQIILNCHPARWNNNLLIWLYRYFLQKLKNITKLVLKKIRN